MTAFTREQMVYKAPKIAYSDHPHRSQRQPCGSAILLKRLKLEKLYFTATLGLSLQVFTIVTTTICGMTSFQVIVTISLLYFINFEHRLVPAI